jgi:hypothetical protein
MMEAASTTETSVKFYQTTRAQEPRRRPSWGEHASQPDTTVAPSAWATSVLTGTNSVSLFRRNHCRHDRNGRADSRLASRRPASRWSSLHCNAYCEACQLSTGRAYTTSPDKPLRSVLRTNFCGLHSWLNEVLLALGGYELIGFENTATWQLQQGFKMSVWLRNKSIFI